ncbi:MAG TPA: lysophospholipid acyltransferase family protein [Vicinamibacterales bacterium]|nr:lysophospholipid acyltransferase family protein [Vicinamibacterales bacterium]
MLSRSERLRLKVQEAAAQSLILLTYYGLEAWMRYHRYRIPARRRLRREFQALMGTEPGPWLICANHLTLIDSLVIQWAMAPGWRLFLRRQLFAWNLPDRHNISRTRFLRTLGYLGKCVPVLRQGPPEEARRTLDKVAFLLSSGQTVVIFPEGGRSRVGRVDLERVTYGVGRMLQEVPATRVLCVYARGFGQKEYSDYPRDGERFFVRVRRLSPATVFQGMRGDRDLALQIVRQLSEMESEYLEHPLVDR